jgi:glutamine cyclotransferase
LATDGKVLFGSDGTSRLYQLDPKSIQGNYSSDFVIPIGSCCST